MNEYINRGILIGGQVINGSDAGMISSTCCPTPQNIIPTKAEQLGWKVSNLEIAKEMFIKEYEKEIDRIKRKGTRKEKLAYLKTRMKNKQSIRKQVDKLINERIR